MNATSKGRDPEPSFCWLTHRITTFSSILNVNYPAEETQSALFHSPPVKAMQLLSTDSRRNYLRQIKKGFYCSAAKKTQEKIPVQTLSISWQRSADVRGLMLIATCQCIPLASSGVQLEYNPYSVLTQNRKAWKTGRSYYRCPCKTYGELLSYYNHFLQQFVST